MSWLEDAAIARHYDSMHDEDHSDACESCGVCMATIDGLCAECWDEIDRPDESDVWIEDAAE